jgi:hypothetical protein
MASQDYLTPVLGASVGVIYPAGGLLRITNPGDTAPTTLASGITIGIASGAGASLVYDSTYGLRSMTNNLGTNLGFAGVAFNALAAMNVNFGVNIGVASQTGMGHPTLTSIAWYVSNTQYGLVDANGKWSNIRPLTASKATNYTVVSADSGVVFDNTGAGGTVVTFTLPSAATGLKYTFANVLTTALSQIVIAPQAADTIAFGTKTASQTVSSPVATRSSITVVCTAANTWAVTELVGTFT